MPRLGPAPGPARPRAVPATACHHLEQPPRSHCVAKQLLSRSVAILAQVVHEILPGCMPESPPCHVGCGDRPAVRRSFFGRLVGCLVGRIPAADVQGKPDPRSPHVQWRHSPVPRTRHEVLQYLLRGGEAAVREESCRRRVSTRNRRAGRSRLAGKQAILRAQPEHLGIGHPHFIAAFAESRMHTERQFLNQLLRLPDLQCAWLLLSICASPRANAPANWREGTPKRLASVAHRWHATSFTPAEGWQGARPSEQSRMAPAHQLADWLAAQCVANSQPTPPRAHVATRHATQRLTLLRCQAGPHAGTWLTAIPAEPCRANHHTVPGDQATCVAPPFAPPTPPPSTSVRPLSRVRRARRRLRRPCLSLPSHQALGPARTGVMGIARDAIASGGPAAVPVHHHCFWHSLSDDRRRP